MQRHAKGEIHLKAENGKTPQTCIACMHALMHASAGKDAQYLNSTLCIMPQTLEMQRIRIFPKREWENHLTHACLYGRMHTSAGQDACMVSEEHLVYHATDTGDV